MGAEVAPHGEPGAEPAETGRKQQSEQAVRPGEVGQFERNAVKSGQRAQLVVENQQGKGSQQPGSDTAGDADESTEIQEGALDPAVCGADQFRDLDFIALGEDLQTDGVEGDCDQRQRQRCLTVSSKPWAKPPSRLRGRSVTTTPAPSSSSIKMAIFSSSK